VKVHLVNESMLGYILNKGSKRKEVTHAHTEGMLFGFGCDESYLCLQFTCPGDGTTAINKNISSPREYK